MAEFNRRFQVARRRSPARPLCPAGGKDLDLIFSLQFERSGEPGQHGQLSEPGSADRQGALARQRWPAAR
jgi:hypothetical protein